jgi:choloylglycine hydrolase
MCTRIVWVNDDVEKVPLVGRIMDWGYDDYEPDLWILPRGGSRDGGTKSNPILWDVRYGSLVAPLYWKVRRNGTVTTVATSTDGINEKGLSGHTLWLGKTEYPQAGDRKTLNVGKWLQYYLDQFKTVADATRHAAKAPYRLVAAIVGTIPGMLHLTLEDGTGDCAVIEYINGVPHIHPDPARHQDSRDYWVITNSLTCDLQSRNTLSQYKPFGGTLELPGSTDSRHRFIRAWHYLLQLPKPRDEKQRVAYMLSVLRNVSYPFGKIDQFAPPPQDNLIPSTRWRSVTNLRDKRYYFESTTTLNICWVDLDMLRFDQPKRLDLHPRSDLFGEVSGRFVAAEPFEWLQAEDAVP